MTVAVLSDVHGVLPALEAVLAEPDVVAADRIVLLGDALAGPMPVETLSRLESLGPRAVWVRGNADRELAASARGAGDFVPDPIFPWAAKQLRPGDLPFLDALPLTVTLDGVLFCHATPRDDAEIVLVDSPLERWAEVLDGVTARTVVCGHTHMPFVRLADRRLIVNPGSVGMPYGARGAHWALLGDGVELRRTEYDVEAACRFLAEHCAYPAIEEWADFFVRDPASDAEALRVFSGRGTSST
ncbi:MULTISPECIES: metallophosphoesterase family protein [unclassified Amycolatopsis]|uniref:metallophosphoesterase family protein n=1 Tax=unclassified Amycolatopsis TaxID=2618356 RepID=UPI001FF3C6B4|nr:metallophosphoesterase family protein [Amycolatopsis sp. FBCC-B4732]UOX84662.1 metallophosphatase family protein [Amycolatopsis sp. FBCC-B4732]